METILRRLLIMIPQLFIVSVLVFFLAKLMPGDPFSGKFGPNTDPAQIAALRKAAGLMIRGRCSMPVGLATRCTVILVILSS